MTRERRDRKRMGVVCGGVEGDVTYFRYWVFRCRGVQTLLRRGMVPLQANVDVMVT